MSNPISTQTFPGNAAIAAAKGTTFAGTFTANSVDIIPWHPPECMPADMVEFLHSRGWVSVAGGILGGRRMFSHERHPGKYSWSEAATLVSLEIFLSLGPSS